MANVGAGAYLVSAKTSIVQTQGKDEAGDTILCTLDAGGTIDTAEVEIGQKKGGVQRATIVLQLTKTFAASGSIVLRCQSGADFDIAARHTTIVASGLGAVTRTAVSG